MSIYPVKMTEWFPKNDKMYAILISFLPFLRCEECGRIVTYDDGYIMHSAPWGGPSQAWCSEECLKK